MGKPKVQKPSDSSVPAISDVEVPPDYLLNELEGNKYVDQKIREMIKGVILGDKDVDKEIEKIVEKIEKEKIRIFWTKIGFGLWTLISIILGSVLTVILEKIANVGN